MSQDLTQWIAEVRTLQRQLADTRRERDQAHNSAANWRRLYENEARQRRQEAEQYQAQIADLLQRLEEQKGAQAEAQTLAEGLEQADSMASLEGQLTALVQRCHQLNQSLNSERQAHDHTRQTLIAALGDTFDMIKLEPSPAVRPTPAALSTASSR
jgi:predicted RNase H-like nuclease (RuvC/YqgF family)